jgi:hypothetical protein
MAVLPVSNTAMAPHPIVQLLRSQANGYVILFIGVYGLQWPIGQNVIPPPYNPIHDCHSLDRVFAHRFSPDSMTASVPS